MSPTVSRCLVVACAIALVACEADAPSESAKNVVEQEPDRFVQMVEEPEEAPAPTEGQVERDTKPSKSDTTKVAAAKVEEVQDVKLAKKAEKAKLEPKTTLQELTVGGDGQGAGGLGLKGAGRGGGGGAIGHGKVGSIGKIRTASGSGRGLGSSSLGFVARGSASYGAAAPRPERQPRANTEAYTNHGVNQMTQTAKDAQSTFAIDVDTGAYTIARRKLESGQMPPKSAVRVEEFVNYFRYSYPDPDSGAFGVHMEAAPSPFVSDDNRKVLRVGVQGKRVTKTSRKPVHLTFLVDVSGSMSSPDKLGLAQKSLEILTDNLHEGDSVAISTYAGRVAKILDPTGIENKGRIQTAIKSLRSGGSTAMNSGLELAYKLALSNYKKDHVNRVIVLSDGDANVGPSSHPEILKRIKHFVDEGVTLSTIGFGMGNYKDTLMEQLANNGNGNYYYIDSEKEARKVFGEQLDGTLQVIAKDVKIQVEFNKDAVKSYRLIGYENRDIADKDFRNDKVDAGEIGAGHTVTALYELVLTDKEVNKLATVRIRAKKPDGAKASEQAFSLTRGDLKDSLKATSKDFQFAAAVAGFAEILRQSKYAKDVSFDLVEEIARGATLAGQQDREEFIELVKKAKSLEKG